MNRTKVLSLYRALLLAAGTLALAGCVTASPYRFDEIPHIEQTDVPRELDKALLPAYRVEPPDVLLVEAVSNIRPPDDPLREGETILIRVANTYPIDPEGDPIENEFKIINAPFQIQPNGTIDLGPVYGKVKVAGLTFDEAVEAVSRHLSDEVGLNMPRVSISFPDVAGKQVISGEHLVRPDGTISLGIYGSLNVTGLTLEEIEMAIEHHLEGQIKNPEVYVDVLGYNSKVYYVITDGGGYGETVIRLPYTGNETVLDGISQVNGLSEVSSRQIWVARPAPNGMCAAQTMMVDWRAITQDGVTTTNYQLYPGDRIYIKANGWVTLDTFIARVTAPAERIMGFTLLGHGLVRTLQFGHLQGGFGGGFGGGFIP